MHGMTEIRVKCPKAQGDLSLAEEEASTHCSWVLNATKTLHKWMSGIAERDIFALRHEDHFKVGLLQQPRF